MTLGELVARVLLWVTKFVLGFQTIRHASLLKISFFLTNELFFQGNLSILLDAARVRGYIRFVLNSNHPGFHGRRFIHTLAIVLLFGLRLWVRVLIIHNLYYRKLK